MIHSFIEAHRSVIASAYVTSERVEIKFIPAISALQALTFAADLHNYASCGRIIVCEGGEGLTIKVEM